MVSQVIEIHKKNKSNSCKRTTIFFSSKLFRQGLELFLKKKKIQTAIIDGRPVDIQT